MNRFTYTSPGPRPTNQDSVLVVEHEIEKLLMCVADGVGGNKGGEIASKIAVEEFSRSYLEMNSSLKEAVTYAHNKILESATENVDLRGMATTLTALYIHGHILKGVHVGDSRAYVLRGNGVKQLSIDHSEVARYLREGKLTKEEAGNYPRKNVLYSALGTHKNLEIQDFEFPLEPKDRLVLMSDGVYGAVSKKDFRDLSNRCSDVEILGEKIINHIEKIGASDNYSLLIYEVL